jgi:hypothetical protein
MKVNIVTNYSTALRFKAMSQFQLDLGKKNLEQKGKETRMKISDLFVDSFFKTYGFLIYKIGIYGSIDFYYANIVNSSHIYIFVDSLENEYEIPKDISNTDLEKWLSVKLFEITQHVEIKKEL